MYRRVAFPAPYLPGLWIYSLADPFKAKLLQNPRRGVSFRQRVSPHPPDSRSAFREFHKSRRHRTGITSTLKRREGEVRDLNDAFSVRRCCEAARPDDDLMRPIHGEVPGPRGSRPRSLKHRHGLLADCAKKIRFGTKRERVFDSESGGIFCHPCPGRSIENEQPDVCHQILWVRPNVSVEPRRASVSVAPSAPTPCWARAFRVSIFAIPV